MIKAVIFDCFGVVIADGLEAVLLRREQTDPSVRAFAKEIIHKVNRGLLTPTASHRLISERLGISAEDWRQEIYADEIRNEPVIGLIGAIKKKYKTALLSNVGKGSLRHRFSDDELARLFDVVVVSAEVGLAKPDAEIYQLTAKKLKLDVAECVFVDDRQTHVNGAENAGMQAILYRDFEQMKAELERLLAADTKG